MFFICEIYKCKLNSSMKPFCRIVVWGPDSWLPAKGLTLRWQPPSRCHLRAVATWGPAQYLWKNLQKIHLFYWRAYLVISPLLFKQRRMRFNQSKDDSFVERVTKNNNWNNEDRHKIQEKFLINFFVFVVTLVWQTVHGSATTQIAANVNNGRKHCV